MSINGKAGDRRVHILDPRSVHPELCGQKVYARTRIEEGDRTLVPVIGQDERVSWHALDAAREHLLEENGFLIIGPDGSYERLAGFSCLPLAQGDLFYLLRGVLRNQQIILDSPGMALDPAWIISTSRCTGEPIRQACLRPDQFNEFFFAPEA